MSKTLIAYYSFSNNTEEIAKKIQAKTGAEIFKIETVEEYPKDYESLVEAAKKEKEEDIYPEIKENVSNLDEYDTVFIGMPIWWYTIPPVIKTFLKHNNLNGKTIVPFCTHGGGGSSSAFMDLKKLIPEGKFKEGYVVYGKGNLSTDKEIENWIKKILTHEG